MEDTIIEKIKLDIDERKISYQKELQKIKEEKNLLGYIKGILEISIVVGLCIIAMLI